MIICPKCNKQFTYNYLLLKHQNRKKSCVQINNISENINNSISSDENSNDLNDSNDSDNSINSNDSDNSINSNDSNKKNINRKNKINILDNNDKKIIKVDKNIKIIEDKLALHIKNSTKNLKCKECDKDFSKRYNIMRHINYRCEYIKKLNEDKNKLELEKTNLTTQIEIKQLRNAVSKLLKKKSQNINITNNNKITNNNLMVNINSFGNESLSHITINDYKRFLSGLFPGFIGFIEKVHFDENAPENHNICTGRIYFIK